MNESTLTIEVCISTDATLLGRDVIVTVMTGRKNTSTNQAIGKRKLEALHLDQVIVVGRSSKNLNLMDEQLFIETLSSLILLMK